MDNISIAFPGKTNEERVRIAKQFYKNLVDTFIETIKMLSLSTREFEKRCTIDAAAATALAEKGKSIEFLCGHQMNWEYGNWIMAKNSPIPFIGVYQNISNAVFNRLFLQLRSRYNTIMVSTFDFKYKKEEILKDQYGIALAADQNGNPQKCFWLYFFGKPAPFVTGPAIGAIKNNTAVIFIHSTKPKRGYYHFKAQVMAENANQCSPEKLTIQYRDLLEQAIRETPDNYLWSHRRWRHEFEKSFHHLWIDEKGLN